MKNLLLCLFALSFTACAMTKGYEGPSRSSGEVARIHAHGVAFKEVNGIDVGSTSGGVEVLPGENEIRLLVNASNFNSKGIDKSLYSLKMIAEAGVEYSVTARRGDRRLCAFPLNPANGQPEMSKPAGCIVSVR